MVTVPDKLKPLFPNMYRKSGAVTLTRRRPLKRLRLPYIAIRAAMVFALHLTLAAAIVFYISSVMNSEIAFTAYVNGNKTASVSDPDVIRKAIGNLTLISTDINADFGEGKLPPITKVPDFDFKLSYRFALTGSFGAGAPLNVNECTDKLYKIVRENYAYAFTVYAGNMLVAASKHYNDAVQAVEKIEQSLTDAALYEGEDVDKVCISTAINIEYGLCERSNILSADGLYNRLSKLLAPDTAAGSRVASSANGGADPNIDFGINRVVTINGYPVVMSAAPAIKTENIKVETVTCLVEYKTRYVESDEYYTGHTFVQTKGVAGLERVTYDLVMDDGNVEKRRVVSREILIDPVDEIIIVGTCPPPQPVPTGSFDCPVIKPYSVTSNFGEQRIEFDGDAFHYGVDFSADKGEPIYAADGGTVVYSGYSKSYGLMLKLDHGNGFTTVYAHCSKLLFDVGDKVYKGQQIALVGDTGVTTGAHLHFEIRKNGVYVNPLKFLDK